MGRRRERRLAALNAAGRRVKVDLSADSSGDMFGSSAQEDVAENGDPKTHAEFQTLHTSSGELQPNTLQLLEQYSDEDSDEGQKEHNDCAPSIQEKLIDQEETENGRNDDIKELNDQVDQFLKDNFPTEEHSEEKMDTGVVDVQDLKITGVIGAINQAEHDKRFAENPISGWKMVLHEESNCYYYWNIETGETSWEVPDVFSQSFDGSFENNAIVNSEAKLVSVKEADFSDEGPKMESIDESNLSNLLELMNKCESLVERLKSVKSSNCNLDSQQYMKYMVEIEVRNGDIKALASCGSCLLPFWLHIEAHLNHIEIGLGRLVESRNSSSVSPEITADINKDNGICGIDSNAKSPSLSPGETRANATLSPPQVQNQLADMSGFGPHQMSSTHNPEDVGEKDEALEAEKNEFDCRQGLHAGEEVEMDVDMEVEEISSVEPVHLLAPGPHHCASVEQSEVPDRSTTREMVVPGQAVGGFSLGDWIPPPPDDESFPPPPPDDEPCPPPPEEAQDTSYPSLQLGSLPSFQHSGEFAVPYPVHSLQYYGQPDEVVAGTSLYTQLDTVQMCISHLPHYYDPITNTYAVTSLEANPVEPAAYYSLPMEAQHSGQSIVSGALGATGESFPGTADSSLVASSGSIAEANSGFLSSKDFRSAAIYLKSSKDTDIQPASGAPEASSGTSVRVQDSVSNNSAAATKAQQSKVMRGKKRVVAVVPMMKASKKVSGLVDKWKAVKEELSVEDEESEGAYEILEKKRQREIEEWRANQVASGAARDNANFQPLGGDWRERVKRRKAERVKECKESSNDEKQKPDLVELAKGLPSGWQAYWDESSRKVYYGNVVTSKTTWTRPKV